MDDGKETLIKAESEEVFSEEDIKISELLKVFYDQKKAIFVFVFLSSLIAAIYSLTITPIFRSEVLLISTEQSNGAGMSGLAGLGALAGIQIDSDNNLNSSETIMAILESRTFSDSYVQEKNLMPILFANDWDPDKGQWKDSSNIPNMWDAYGEMKKILSVSKDRKTSLVTLSVEWSDPNLAAEWANDAVRKINDYMRLDIIEESKKSISFLEEQLAKTNSAKTESLLYEMIQEQTNRAMLATIRNEYSFKIIDKAVPAQKRIKPHRKVIVVYGFALGLFLGIAFVLLRNSFGNRNKGV